MELISESCQSGALLSLFLNKYLIFRLLLKKVHSFIDFFDVLVAVAVAVT